MPQVCLSDTVEFLNQTYSVVHLFTVSQSSSCQSFEFFNVPDVTD